MPTGDDYWQQPMVLLRVVNNPLPVRLEDVDVPSKFSIEFVNRPGWPCSAVIDVEVDPDHGAVPVGIRTIPLEGGRPVSAVTGLKLLREVGSIPQIVRSGVAAAAGNLAQQRVLGHDDALRRAHFRGETQVGTEAYQGAVIRAETAAGKRSRRVLTDGFLAQVAVVYEAALTDGDSPLRRLMREFHAERSTVNRWCKIARSRGLLVPSKRGPS